MIVRIARLLLRTLAVKPKTVWVGLAAMLAVGIGVSAVRARLDASSSVLVGRIWIDHLPKNDTEHFEVFVAIEDGAVGVFERASVYEGAFEVFKYEPKGEGKLQLIFPQSKKKFDVTYEAKACKDGDFDYCLSLSGAPRGAPKYVSKKGWELDAKDPADLERAIRDWEQKRLETAAD